MEKNRDKVKAFLFKIMGNILPEDINYDDEEIILKDLELEDIDYTEIAIECEEEFEIILDEIYMEEKLKTVRDLIDYIFDQYKNK